MNSFLCKPETQKRMFTATERGLAFLTGIYAETKEETGSQLQQQEVVDCDQQGKHCKTTSA